MTHFSDGLSVGGAFTNPIIGSQGGFGVNTTQSVILDIVPLTKNASAYAASQSVVGASNLVLSAGTGITAVSVGGVIRYTADVERCVTITSGGNDLGITFLVTGYDGYGNILTSRVTGTNGGTATTLKTFISVIGVVTSGSTASTVTVGTADTFAAPVRVVDKGYVSVVSWANVLGFDTGTFTVADQTSPATSLTGDTQGTYAPSSASNGSRRLVIEILLSAAQVAAGPSAAASLAILGTAQA